MAVYGKVLDLLNETTEITADQINEMCLFFNNRPLTESYINEAVNQSCQVSGFFFKLGVQNPYLIEQRLKSAAGEIGSTIKKEGITSSSKKSIATSIRKCYEDIIDIIKCTDVDIPESIENTYDPNKLKNGILLTIADVLINTLCKSILEILFGSNIGTLLTAIIVGPIVEEISKHIAVRGEFAVEYTFVFNFYEVSSYINTMTNILNMPLKNAIRGRLFCVGMHLVNTIINWLTTNKNVQKKLGLEKEEDKDKLSLIGNITGILIHMTWNTLASFSKTFNSFILGIKF